MSELLERSEQHTAMLEPGGALAGPVGLFLIAHLAFPVPTQGANFRDYYYGPMRAVWVIAAITVMMATLFRPVVFGWDLIVPDNATSLIFFAGFALLSVSKSPTLHAATMSTFLFLVLLDILRWSPTISTG